MTTLTSDTSATEKPVKTPPKKSIFKKFKELFTSPVKAILGLLLIGAGAAIIVTGVGTLFGTSLIVLGNAVISSVISDEAKKREHHKKIYHLKHQQQHLL